MRQCDCDSKASGHGEQQRRTESAHRHAVVHVLQPISPDVANLARDGVPSRCPHGLATVATSRSLAIRRLTVDQTSRCLKARSRHR